MDLTTYTPPSNKQIALTNSVRIFIENEYNLKAPLNEEDFDKLYERVENLLEKEKLTEDENNELIFGIQLVVEYENKHRHMNVS